MECMGSRIKVLCEERGMSIAELSKMIGVDRTYISHLINRTGTHHRMTKRVIEIADALGSSPEYILYGTDSPDTSEEKFIELKSRLKCYGSDLNESQKYELIKILAN